MYTHRQPQDALMGAVDIRKGPQPLAVGRSAGRGYLIAGILVILLILIWAGVGSL
jgi:hypothetical protein